jgi:hypothetical protein
MIAGETVRCTCHECLVAFEVFLAPREEWPEGMEDPSDATADYEPPMACPFCMSSDMTITPTAQIEGR